MKRKRFPGAVFGVLLAVFLILFIVVHLVDSDREEHGVKEAPGKTAEPGEAELTEEEGTDVVSIQDVPVYEVEAK